MARNVAGSVHHSVSLIVEDEEKEYLWRSNGPLSLREVRFRPPNKQLIDYYDLGDRLGGGTQSRVYHCVEKSSGMWEIIFYLSYVTPKVHYDLFRL